MPFIQVNDIDLFYEVHGEGPVIVFAHGMAGSHLSWWQQVPIFSRNFQCIIYDLRGKGQTGGTEDGPVEGAFREDLKGLLDHLEIREVYLVCQSMGGRTGCNFTVTYPERVKGLVLSGSRGGYDPVVEEAREKHAATLAEKDRSFPFSVVAKSFLDDQPAKAFLYQLIRGLNPPHQLLDGELLSTRQLSDSKVPTFMILGEEDYRFPPEVTNMYRKRLPDAQILTIPGSGHSPYFEKPEIFNEAVMDFISTIEDQG